METMTNELTVIPRTIGMMTRMMDVFNTDNIEDAVIVSEEEQEEHQRRCGQAVALLFQIRIGTRLDAQAFRHLFLRHAPLFPCLGHVPIQKLFDQLGICMHFISLQISTIL